MSHYFYMLINGVANLSRVTAVCSGAEYCLLDDGLYPDSEDEKLWLENEILIADGSLILHSNEIGDEVGTIKKVTNIQYL